MHDPSDPIDANGVLDGAKRAAQKQASRDRDEAMLQAGEITHEGLARKNGMFAAVDVSKLRIVSVGGVPYEDLNKGGSKRFRR